MIQADWRKLSESERTAYSSLHSTSATPGDEIRPHSTTVLKRKHDLVKNMKNTVRAWSRSSWCKVRNAKRTRDGDNDLLCWKVRSWYSSFGVLAIYTGERYFCITIGSLPQTLSKYLRCGYWAETAEKQCDESTLNVLIQGAAHGFWEDSGILLNSLLSNNPTEPARKKQKSGNSKVDALRTHCALLVRQKYSTYTAL